MSWDYEHAETREPVKSPRVVVSVAFRWDDFQRVAQYAERAGKKTSEFIREAAIDRATGRGTESVWQLTSSPGAFWFTSAPPSYSMASGIGEYTIEVTEVV